ncbi:MAG: chemotaxis protein CheB [Bacteroidota bacterium]
MSTAYKAVVIGGSAGSFPVLTKILMELPGNYRLPVLVTMHRLKHVREGFAEALNYKAQLKVSEPYDKERIKSGQAWLAPANYHMLVEAVGHTIALSTGELVRFSRPSIDVMLESAADCYRDKLIAVLLSGANTDGVNGMTKIKALGGTTIAQDPDECAVRTMTESAIKRDCIDKVLNTNGIVEFLKAVA